MSIANMYADLISKGQFSFNNVPEIYQADVNGILNLSTIKYLYYNYGCKNKLIDSSSYVPAEGETAFSSVPTSDQIKSAFPSIAGSITHTISTNAAVSDTVTIQNKKLTAGTNFQIGADAAATAINIAAALNATALESLYAITVSNAAITLTERIAGGGNTPAGAISSGTIAITSSVPIASKKGYTTVLKLQALESVNNIYLEYCRQYDRAQCKIGRDSSLTDAEKSANLAAVIAQQTALDNWIKNRQEAIKNG